ncbi:MAG: outer membrane lipid asymmetry maintenance protein MlaD [Wenzhouxiangellaceae bacterium]
MRTSHTVEFTSGLFILIGLAALVFLALQSTDLGGVLREGSYTISARFGNIGDLKARAPVSIGGVAVGNVEKVELDPATFEAVVTMKISTRYTDLPEDTSASILTQGVLGDQYVGLEPGGSLETLGDGDELFITQSAVVLENLISKYLFNSEEETE